MTDRTNATKNRTSAFQGRFGSYKGFSIACGRPTSVTQAWRLRDNIPPDHHWDVAQAAVDFGLFRTHYAALKFLHEEYGLKYERVSD